MVATLDGVTAYKDAEFVIVAAPTNYDPHKNFFDTFAVEDVVRTVTEVNPSAVIVIKSTVPVEYTVALSERMGNPNILPDFITFLRHHIAHNDNQRVT